MLILFFYKITSITVRGSINTQINTLISEKDLLAFKFQNSTKKAVVQKSCWFDFQKKLQIIAFSYSFYEDVLDQLRLTVQDSIFYKGKLLRVTSNGTLFIDTIDFHKQIQMIMSQKHYLPVKSKDYKLSLGLNETLAVVYSKQKVYRFQKSVFVEVNINETIKQIKNSKKGIYVLTSKGISEYQIKSDNSLNQVLLIKDQQISLFASLSNLFFFVTKEGLHSFSTEGQKPVVPVLIWKHLGIKKLKVSKSQSHQKYMVILTIREDSTRIVRVLSVTMDTKIQVKEIHLDAVNVLQSEGWLIRQTNPQNLLTHQQLFVRQLNYTSFRNMTFQSLPTEALYVHNFPTFQTLTFVGYEYIQTIKYQPGPISLVCRFNQIQNFSIVLDALEETSKLQVKQFNLGQIKFDIYEGQRIPFLHSSIAIYIVATILVSLTVFVCNLIRNEKARVNLKLKRLRDQNMVSMANDASLNKKQLGDISYQE